MTFRTFRLRAAGFAALLIASAAVCLAQPPEVDDSYFADRVYPILHEAQCALCHADNGVASATSLEFPEPTANREQIIAFGLQLRDLIDPDDPEQSWVLLKPTNREEHTGGVRIEPGSSEEQRLLTWIRYLVTFDEEDHARVDRLVADSRKYELQPLSIRRLTHSQYNNTVRDLLGDLSNPASHFPAEDFVNGFQNQLAAQGVSPIQAEAYSAAAERLAQAAFRGGDPQSPLPCEPTSPFTVECAREFVATFGLRAFRRPLDDGEIQRYVELLKMEAERTGEFVCGAQLVIETMLQSPHFLYRIERGPGSPNRQFETASRLSYFLWDTMPDDDLLQAAASGELATREQVEAYARRMLNDDRARGAFEEFLSQWLRFDRVLGATRDRRRFRGFNSETAIAMTEETRRLFNHLVWNDENFLEFLTADYTFINNELAELYGLEPPTEPFGRVTYPEDSPRGGILGHGTVLLLTSKPSETSPTARGLFVRNQLLGQEVPPPPAGVSTELPEVTEDRPMTNRERLSLHLSNESCSACHKLIDPIGLAFEQFNAVGEFEEKMSLRFGSRRDPKVVELDIDTTAFIQGVENSEFSSPKELGRILAENETCHRAIVKQLFRYAFGRQETLNDQPVIDELLAKFRESDFRFRELIIAIVTSELFLEGGST